MPPNSPALLRFVRTAETSEMIPTITPQPVATIINFHIHVPALKQQKSKTGLSFASQSINKKRKINRKNVMTFFMLLAEYCILRSILYCMCDILDIISVGDFRYRLTSTSIHTQPFTTMYVMDTKLIILSLQYLLIYLQILDSYESY